jgi:hypothetical protein
MWPAAGSRTLGRACKRAVTPVKSRGAVQLSRHSPYPAQLTASLAAWNDSWNESSENCAPGAFRAYMCRVRAGRALRAAQRPPPRPTRVSSEVGRTMATLSDTPHCARSPRGSGRGTRGPSLLSMCFPAAGTATWVAVRRGRRARHAAERAEFLLHKPTRSAWRSAASSARGVQGNRALPASASATAFGLAPAHR